MSAPDTNIERQKTRHRTMASGIWIGVAVAVAVAVIMVVAIGFFGAEPTAVVPVEPGTSGN